MGLLKVERLSKSFTLHTLGEKTIHGFSDLSFEIGKGQVLALAGPSGSGKSSVLKCIYRTYLPSQGRILYQSPSGEDLDLAALPENRIIALRRGQIGFVSQFLKVLPRVAAADVVAEPLIQQGMMREAAREQAEELLCRLNIPSRLHDAFPVTFSGGEQQRVNIARAVIGRPRLLLLDEPTASLDVNSVQVVLDLLDELRRGGTTMVMICHDQEVARQIADVILPMSPQAIGIRKARESESTGSGAASLVIANGNLVLKDRIAELTDLAIVDGKIGSIGALTEQERRLPRVDASGLWVMPGFIDLHSDAIEKAIEPRPRAELPIEIALTELDKNLAACGITTMHHCISFTEKENNRLRYYERSAELVRRIKQLAPEMLVRTRVHARYEILETGAIAMLNQLMQQRLIDLLSLMDHTPGQGQFRNEAYLYEYYTKAAHLTRQQVDDMVKRRVARRSNFDDGHIRELVQESLARQIPVASHDDDTRAKVAWVQAMGVGISEFPVTMEAARAARELGMGVLMGAPNIIFGRSLSDNLSGRDAVAARCCNLIGSDYSPNTLLHAVFRLEKEGLGNLPELIRMVSHQPAEQIGQSHRFGSIDRGLSADLVLVDGTGRVPRVRQTYVAGIKVYASSASGRNENARQQTSDQILDLENRRCAI
jgi:alpha-D-ribose 1-methylphosphonate 5-triphosphate diphosphatase